MDCQHWKEGNCTLLTAVIKHDVPARDDVCAICSIQPNPRSLNHVTCSRAISFLSKEGLLKPEFQALFRCVDESSPRAILGRQLWKELHEKQEPTQEWFDEWFKKVGELDGCGCQESAEQILKRMPPRFNDWFPWSVEFHNEVNRKLGKRSYSIEEALRIWR